MTHMGRRVVITGYELISPLGDTLDAVYQALCEGQSRCEVVDAFETDELRCDRAHAIADFTPETYLGKRNLRPLDRTSRLVLSASALALENSGWTEKMRAELEVGLVLGTMFCSVHTISEFDRRGLNLGPSYVSPMDFANTVINAAAGQAAIRYGLRGINSTISSGMASGLQAIAYAADMIRYGQATALLAGGAEELCFESFYGFDRAGLLADTTSATETFAVPFDAGRNGFVLREGAALIMLEDAEVAAARGATVLAEVKGHGSGYDLSCGADRQQAVGAIARSLRLALRDVGVEEDVIDGFSVSANGSVLADDHEALGIAEVFQERASALPVMAVKSMLGEMLGASGAMQTLALLAATRKGVIPGIRALQQVAEDFPLPQISSQTQGVQIRHGLVNTVSFDGHCCSLVLAAGDSL
ncbi:hypothetical protein C2W62_20535 [Candidatus Entotheonella serta]|nr:hypothetical protein C2W62_20535 [Candidatus Entotheonella serta]